MFREFAPVWLHKRQAFHRDHQEFGIHDSYQGLLTGSRSAYTHSFIWCCDILSESIHGENGYVKTLVICFWEPLHHHSRMQQNRLPTIPCSTPVQHISKRLFERLQRLAAGRLTRHFISSQHSGAPCGRQASPSFPITAVGIG